MIETGPAQNGHSTAVKDLAPLWRDWSTVIFTDLDGTLLDDESHSYAAALPALRELKRAGVPVIPVTSKTAAEVRHLREQLDLDGPYVVENGGAIFLPHCHDGEQRITLGCARGELRRFLIKHREEFGLRGFGDMTVAEISARTGLTRKAAYRASLREYTEPFVLHSRRRIRALAERAWLDGFRVDQGGRFLYLSGRHDKGSAVRWILGQIDTECSSPVRAIGLGDAPNDLPFLLSVDEAITIPRPDGQHVRWPSDQDVRRAPFSGSRGWNVAIHELLGVSA